MARMTKPSHDLILPLTRAQPQLVRHWHQHSARRETYSSTDENLLCPTLFIRIIVLEHLMSIPTLDPLLLILGTFFLILLVPRTKHRSFTPYIFVSNFDESLLKLHLRGLLGECPGVNSSHVTGEDLTIVIEVVEQEFASPETFQIATEGERW